MSLQINSDVVTNDVQSVLAPAAEQAGSGAAFSEALSEALAPDQAVEEAQASAAEEAAPAPATSSGFELDGDTALMLCMMMMSNSGSSDGLGGGISEILTTILLKLFTDNDTSTVDDGRLLSGNSSAKTPADYSEIVQSALTRLGDPYSQSKAGSGDYTDCSYLTRWCYREIGINLPRTAAAQAKYCEENDMTISKDELQPGDLIFFSLKNNGRYKNISHVGIYAGDGMMVDASSANGKVVHREVFDTGLVMYARPRKD